MLVRSFMFHAGLCESRDLLALRFLEICDAMTACSVSAATSCTKYQRVTRWSQWHTCSVPHPQLVLFTTGCLQAGGLLRPWWRLPGYWEVLGSRQVREHRLEVRFWVQTSHCWCENLSFRCVSPLPRQDLAIVVQGVGFRAPSTTILSQGLLLCNQWRDHGNLHLTAGDRLGPSLDWSTLTEHLTIWPVHCSTRHCQVKTVFFNSSTGPSLRVCEKVLLFARQRTLPGFAAAVSHG